MSSEAAEISEPITPPKENPDIDLATPGDDPEAPPRKKSPTRANRYRLFDDDTGDYRIYQLASKDSGLPAGSMMPVAEVPGFKSTYLAKKFIENSGDTFTGMQLMIFKGLDICSIDVEVIKTVKVNFKPKTAITGPAAGESGEADGE